MKLQNLSSKKKKLVEKSDKIHSKDMSDNMDSDEREQIKKDQVKVYDIVEDLKLGKLS